MHAIPKNGRLTRMAALTTSRGIRSGLTQLRLTHAHHDQSTSDNPVSGTGPDPQHANRSTLSVGESVHSSIWGIPDN